MINYAFLPTGRITWVEVARKLHNENLGEPVLWLGDGRFDELAKKSYPKCSVLNLVDINSNNFEIEHVEIKGLPVNFRKNLISIRDQFFKLMDRYDPYQSTSSFERDSIFYRMSLFLLNELNKSKVQLLLMCDTPHSLPSFLLLKLCELKNIPVYSFLQCSFAPIIFLQKSIDGDFLRHRADYSLVDKDVDFYLHNHLKRINDSINGSDVVVPYYMEQQKNIDLKNKKKYTKIKKNIMMILKGNQAQRNYFIPKFLGRGLFSKFESLFYEINKYDRADSLLSSLRKNEETYVNLDEDYVFFPLHYEPEKTTNPDGGDFYDQMSALIELRNLIPENVEIYVKEHYSQFTGSLKGWMGRDSEFYENLKSIEGIRIINENYSSKELILNSKMVASIGGTASLEAALMGIPSLIFGNPWFREAPGVQKFSETTRYESILENSVKISFFEICEWFEVLLREYGVVSCINPSNERVFLNSGFSFCNAKEVDNIFMILLNIFNSKGIN